MPSVKAPNPTCSLAGASGAIPAGDPLEGRRITLLQGGILLLCLVKWLQLRLALHGARKVMHCRM